MTLRTPPDNADSISHNRDARHAPISSVADVALSRRTSTIHRVMPWYAEACADDDLPLNGSDDPDAGFVHVKTAVPSG